MIMDTFQGWCTVGTENTRDYRQLSAVFVLLRIALVCEFLTVHRSKLMKWVAADVVPI